jgi:predicted nucleotidyltransferase
LSARLWRTDLSTIGEKPIYCTYGKGSGPIDYQGTHGWAAGVLRLSLFGSVARDEATAESDVDVVVHLKDAIMKSGFGYFGAMEDVRLKLQEIIGRPVDVVSEPISKNRLAREIERDRQVAF